MGSLSIQEFLAGREPCDVCSSTDNQQHCISELLSRQDSCILFNAIEHNQTDQTPNDTVLLQELRYVSNPVKVLDYYIRSQRITEDINSRPNRVDIWNFIHQVYVGKILLKLRTLDKVGTFNDIMTMVKELEVNYGVKH